MAAARPDAAELAACLRAQGAPVSLAPSALCAEGGLGLHATRTIRAGERLLVERPLACTVASTARARVCATCLADARRRAGGHEWALRCDACGMVHFCSEPCARAAAATSHDAAECAALLALRAMAESGELPEGTLDLAAQAVRILADRAAGRSVRPFPGAPDAERVSYASYARRLRPISRTRRSAEPVRAAVVTALRALPPRARVPPAELYDVLNRHQANAFGVTGPGGCDLALASFVSALHLLNHSCAPNVLFDSVPLTSDSAPRADDGGSGARADGAAEGERGAPPLFQLVALRELPEGTELLHCYAASADGPAARARYLQEHYGFECGCERCACADALAEAELSERLDALRCVQRAECGSGLTYPVRAGLPAAADEHAARADRTRLRRCVHCGAVAEHGDAGDGSSSSERSGQ